jgi:hypothetical protein
MTTDDLDTRVKLEIYATFARTGSAPRADRIAWTLSAPFPEVAAAYARIAKQRLLLLESDGITIRMAPPFSGVPTPHRVHVDGVEYHANCAWDALGIPAALHRAGLVESRCGQSDEPLRIDVGRDGPPPSEWLFHCAVPAARWWQDLVYT